MDLFDDVDEQGEVNELLVWWNRQIFPSYSSARRPVNKNSALAKIREKRSAMKAREANTENSV